MLARTPTEKKSCRCCGKKFAPKRAMQAVCGMRCAQAEIKKKEVASRRAERESLQKRKEAVATKPELLRSAQKAMNAYVRERDKDQPCICCGRKVHMVDGLFSHGWDAGHYVSVGAAQHLRFNEDNVHRQLVYCNRDLAGNHSGYRKGLIERIGLERVEALETDQSSPKWTHDDLRAIKALYVAKLKELKK